MCVGQGWGEARGVCRARMGGGHGMFRVLALGNILYSSHTSTQLPLPQCQEVDAISVACLNLR